MTPKDLIELPINKILEIIFKIYDEKTITSIVLLGSAARNEITIFTNHNSKQIISDIEICVFFKNFIIALLNRKKINLIINNFKIEILFTHQIFLKYLKTPLIYDLKTTGKILWGKDIRNSFWINKPSEIPYWEAVRLLYNRLIPFEKSLWKYINNKPVAKEDEYNHVKLLIAIGELLMIKNGTFTSSYKEKLEYLRKNYNKDNKIINLILSAFEYKLNIKSNFNKNQLMNITSIIVYNILKKINPKLKNFKIPLSMKISDIYKKFLKKDFSNFFFKPKIIEIYKIAFHFLEYFIKSPQNFSNYENRIQLLVEEWKNCLQIQSSFI